MAQRSMDQFVVRTAASSGSKVPTASGSRQRQARIEDLRGVVVVEHMERLKALLECETQTKGGGNLMTHAIAALLTHVNDYRLYIHK